MPSKQFTILQMDNRLHKIISGGQCGADRGGLEAARAMGIETGGWAPKGWKTSFRAAPELGTEFGLLEHESPLYPPRTKMNVFESDGTLIIASSPDSPGTALTQRLCRQLEKPFMVVDPGITKIISYGSEVKKITEWVNYWGIEVLNVAGNRDAADSTYIENATKEIVTSLLLILKKQGKLNIPDA